MTETIFRYVFVKYFENLIYFCSKATIIYYFVSQVNMMRFVFVR